MNSDELKRMNKGFMRKDGKFFLPVTHESLVVDNNGANIKEKYMLKTDLSTYATEDFVKDYVLRAQLGGSEAVDLSRFAKVDHNHDDKYLKLDDAKEAFDNKVNKEEGKSLVLDEDIAKLATLKNYDDTEIRVLLTDKAPANHNHDDKYAAKSFEHTHENKAVLDEITLVRMNTWDSKSDFSGSYRDLTDKPEIPSIEGLATQEFVETRIKEAAKPNFNFKVNLIASNQEAYVTTTGEYPDLIITFNIPQGTGSDNTDVPTVPDTGTPKMWIGYIYWDETGTAGVNTVEAMANKITKSDIDKAKARGGLKEMAPQTFDDYSCGNTEKSDDGVYVCCIYPESSNFDIMIMTSELSGKFDHFNNINSEDGSTGYMLCQQALKIDGQIDGVTYCQSGAFVAADGSKYRLRVRQL